MTPEAFINLTDGELIALRRQHNTTTFDGLIRYVRAVQAASDVRREQANDTQRRRRPPNTGSFQNRWPGR